MSTSLAFVVLFLVVIFILYFIKSRQKTNGTALPPGPLGLPLLGNIHQVAKNAAIKFSQWACQYGNLYTIYLGTNTPTFVVSDPNLIKQLFSTMASTGKFKTELFEVMFDGAHGVFNTEGKQWQEQRQFMARTLKHNKRSPLTEFDHLSRQLEVKMKTQGRVHLSDILKASSGATLWVTATGRQITAEEVELLERWTQAVQKASSSGLFFFSWIKYLAPEESGYRSGVQAVNEMHDIISKIFQERSQEEEDDVTNIISAYVRQMRNAQEKPESTFHGNVGRQHSIKSIMALLVAGIETTATTLNWLIFYLCAHPDVQRKVQQEIDDWVGSDRDPNLGDRNQMPYMEAVISETLRMSSSVPFGVVHRLLKDIPFLDYTLPKGSFLIANIFHVHHNPEIWGDPENFRPERFLDGDGGIKENLVSFQPGRRSCVGEPLARDVLFLFAVKLFQTFNVFPDNGKEKMDYMEGEMGFLCLTKDIGVRVYKRGTNVNTANK